MVPFSATPAAVIGATLVVCAVAAGALAGGKTTDGLAAALGDRYAVRMTCGGEAAFSAFIYGFSRTHAGGKAEARHPGCEASGATPLRHRYRAVVRTTGIWL